MNVTLTQPWPGYVVAGSSVNLAATAHADSPNTVQSVAFLDGTATLSTVTASPYSYTLPNVSPGVHQFSALMTDSANTTLQSQASIVGALPLRTDFPEFVDITQFPDSVLNLWLKIAGKMLIPDRWGDMLWLGLELFAAHNAVLEALATTEVGSGGLPGLSRGVVSAESVDKASLSYDTQSALVLDGGNWNLTVYGTRFLYFARMMGAGPIQIGIGHAPDPLNGPAWAGPDVWPGFSNFGS